MGEMGSKLLAAAGARDTMQLLGKLNGLREAMEWAAMASIVFETTDEDARAQSVVLRAAAALSAMAKSVGLIVKVAGPIVMAGGLLLNQPKLECAVREELGTRCIRLDEPPVAGAVRLAELEFSV
jgi:N-acetylglucosamine kinase-like BadF-type ATPase